MSPAPLDVDSQKWDLERLKIHRCPEANRIDRPCMAVCAPA